MNKPNLLVVRWFKVKGQPPKLDENWQHVRTKHGFACMLERCAATHGTSQGALAAEGRLWTQWHSERPKQPNLQQTSSVQLRPIPMLQIHGYKRVW